VIKLKRVVIQLQRSTIKSLSPADLFSVLNAILGFLSITMSAQGETRYAFSFLLLAFMADGLDGVLARKTRASVLGEHLESMADMTSMGVATSFFMYSVYTSFHPSDFLLHLVVFVVLIFFTTTCILRLALFHTVEKKEYFLGLPASAAALIIVAFSFIKIGLVYMILTVFFLSVLLISKIRFPKNNLVIDVVAVSLIVLNIIVGKNYGCIAQFLLLSSVVLYIFLGPMYVFKKNRLSV